MRDEALKQSNDFWFDAGPLHAIPQRGARTIKTPRREIAVFRTASDEVFALENRCPHKGGPLSDGIVHGATGSCTAARLPAHCTIGSSISRTERRREPTKAARERFRSS